MGAAFDRNVTQWSKGEYYLANNTQDDLAIIAGKDHLPHGRPRKHGSTATALQLAPAQTSFPHARRRSG